VKIVKKTQFLGKKKKICKISAKKVSRKNAKISNLSQKLTKISVTHEIYKTPQISKNTKNSQKFQNSQKPKNPQNFPNLN
jgi:hypothetical protein